MNIIKQWLLRKEINAIEEIAKILKEKEEELERKNRVLQEKQSSFKKEKEAFNNSKQQEITKVIEKYDERYQKEFDDNKKKIQDLLKFKLAPWNKVWILREFDNNIEEITIESITIFKDNKIEIKKEHNFYWEYFATEKEAIEEYNKRIDELKK